MKKFLNLSLLVAVLFGVLPTNHSYAADREHTLKVYNWADYIDESLLEEFEVWYKEQTGEEVEIIYQLFDINEVMLTKIERGHEDFDVVCPSEYIIERMMRKDMLLPINRDFGKTPDYIPNLAPYIQDELNKMSQGDKKVTDYAVAYMWGTAGTLYNTELVTEEEALECANMWNPKFANKLLMKDSYRDCYGLAIIYANKERLAKGEVTVEQLMNDNSPEAIAKAEEYLKAMKPNIAGWEADFGKDQMTKGLAWINLSWSGDAQWAMDEAAEVGVDLNYSIPYSGSTVWFDGWVIPKYARNIKAASYFINFLCMPENVVRNMDAIGYVSAIGGQEVLEAMIDEESFEPIDVSYFFGEEADSVCVNPVLYPDRKVMERCGMMHDVGTEDLLKMWSRIKGDSASAWTYILICLVLGGLIAAVIIKYAKKRYRRRRYAKKRRR